MAALAFACAAALLGGSIATTARAQEAVGGYGSTYEVAVPAGKSQVLQLPSAYTDVMVADPKIADVVPLTTHSVYVIGKTMGSTTLTIYGPGKHLLAAVNVVVSADIEGLKVRLHQVLPQEHDISALAANDAIVLSGTVSSPSALQQAVALADTYAPGKVVNMMGVEGTQQVMLSVRFVEMERSTAKQLGVNLESSALGVNTVTGKPQLAINTTDTLAGAFTLPTFGSISGGYRWGPNSDISVVIDALEDRDLVRTLAEPNLTTMSGETASFLAGGEFPIPVAESTGGGPGSVPTISIEFKQFGIGLAFTPTILQDGLINVVVNPEVSSIDRTISIPVGNGVTVPGLKVDRAHATVELRDGESFTIAGLLSDNYENDVNQFPFVGDVPVLGALFHSTAYQHNQTELVIVVTPHLVTPRKGYVAAPTDHFVPPSDFELFLLGQQEGEASNVRPEDRVLLQADPTQGGIDGPHGHVLY